METHKQIENTEKRAGNRGKGRPRGSPNKSTAEVREAVARLISMNIEDADEWLSIVAYGDDELGVKADPGKALDLLTKISEFHIPKLARTEHSGPDNGPIKHLHSWLD
jgi:hypothetical protein